MTVAALQDKLAKDAPPPSYRDYELMNTDEFIMIVDEKIALDAQKKIIEDRLKAIGPDIEAYLTAESVDKVLYEGGFQVKIGRGRGADKIEATKLVEQGVPIDVIAAATVEGKPYTFAQVVPPKAEKGGR